MLLLVYDPERQVQYSDRHRGQLFASIFGIKKNQKQKQNDNEHRNHIINIQKEVVVSEDFGRNFFYFLLFIRTNRSKLSIKT